MRNLPRGTVTFLFTDIEGSTRLLHEHGDRYVDLLVEHRRVLRDAVARYGGVEVDTQGDAFFVAFARASDAIAAASAGQAGLRNGPIRVRMGLHTGEPVATDEGYVGIDVHRAARIAAAGHGGQVLLSQATRDLVAREAVRDLGEHRLKDLSAPERLFQLGSEDFPALRTLYQTNLPIPATPFLGRERELSEVGALLARPENRLLTLIGPGGTGKTRLALQAVASAAERFTDGVYWVPLGPLRDAELVLDAAMHALGARDGLANHVRDRSLLLLFDNFEHVIDAAPRLSAVLAACPKLQFVVTSRELLRLPGEQAYPVPPLELPDGIELFVARARAVKPDFRPDDTVPDLCAQLDNLPLAIELAAARVPVLSTEQLRERLLQRLDLLKAGRGVDARQQTLRATIEWSYDLLGEDERMLFARLAVFDGGCTLEAAERVCETELDTLESLVDKSLVRLRGGDRFWMLETIRAYAAERFEQSGEEATVRHRHAEYFANLAEDVDRRIQGEGQAGAVAELGAEQHNLRAAAKWSVDGDRRLLARIAAAVGVYWPRLVGSSEELRGWLRFALQVTADLDPALHAKLFLGEVTIAYQRGDYEAMRQYAQQALDLQRPLGKDEAFARALLFLGDARGLAGDRVGARRFYGEVVDTAKTIGDDRHLAVALDHLGYLALIEGDPSDAIDLCAESVNLQRTLGNPYGLASGLCNMGLAALRLDRMGDATRWFCEGLELSAELGQKNFCASCIEGLAAVGARQGDLTEAAQLIGHADHLLADARNTLDPIELELREQTLSALRSELSDHDLGDALEAGRRMPLEDVLTYSRSIN